MIYFGKKERSIPQQMELALSKKKTTTTNYYFLVYKTSLLGLRDVEDQTVKYGCCEISGTEGSNMVINYW